MIKRKKINRTPMGIVNEERINTDGGLVTITNYHLGRGVYEIKIASEDGGVIERFGKMTRGMAWGKYIEKCKHYEGGANLINEGNPISFEDLQEGLPDDLLGRFDY